MKNFGIRDRNTGKIISKHETAELAKKACDRRNQKAREAVFNCPVSAVNYQVVRLNAGIQWESK